MMHWSEASLWATRHPWLWGDKPWGKDGIHLQTLQHRDLREDVVSNHDETPRNTLTNLDPIQDAPSRGRVQLMPVPLSLPRMS